MTQEVQSNTRYFYSNGTVYKQKGEQLPVPLGTKWLKACKVLWGIGILFGLITLGYSIAISVASTSVLPTALVVVSILVSLVGMFLAITAFTAVSSLSASRFKFIILLFAFAPISGFVTTFSMYYTFGPYIRLLFASITTVIFALVWSLPNVLYFMHRKCMFVGTDPEADVKIGKPAAEARPVEDVPKPEQPVAQATAPQVKARIKVVPHRVGSEQPTAAEMVKPAPTAAVVPPTAAKRYDGKMIAIIALAALLVAAVVYIMFDKGIVGEKAQSRSEYVYVSKFLDDDYYHKKICNYSKKHVMLKVSEYDAVQEGYSPCPVCKG